MPGIRRAPDLRQRRRRGRSARVVLAAQSAWAKAMLNNVQAPQSGQPRLELAVDDEEEGEAALLLLRLLRMLFASDVRAALDGQPQLTLLRVLRLADRLQAPRAVAAAAGLLTAAPVFEQATTLAVWQLPDGCADQPAYTSAFEAATKAAHARLGDLSAALADSDGRAALLALPLRVLVSLLRSDETRASSENVVFYACCVWLDARGGGSDMEQRALAACLRLHHMSPLYLTTIVARCGWVPREALALATVWVSASHAIRLRLVKQCGDEVQAPARPASSIKKGAIEWALPLAEVCALHEAAAALGVGRSANKLSHWAPWGGLDWCLRLQATRKEGGVEVGLFLVPRAPPGCTGVGMATANIVVACGGVSECAKPTLYAEVGGWLGGGWADFFGLGVRAAWDAGAWRAKGLVGGGDVVKMTAAIGLLA